MQATGSKPLEGVTVLGNLSRKTDTRRGGDYIRGPVYHIPKGVDWPPEMDLLSTLLDGHPGCGDVSRLPKDV